ncbi:MAG: exo-beta-N-acetylmuramidase NamZ domain-containing protein [Flavobacteriales bacterium]
MKLALPYLLLLFAMVGCSNTSVTHEGENTNEPSSTQGRQEIITGAQQMNRYLPMLRNKRIAIVANQTSMIEGAHLVDTLLNSAIQVVKVFAPEHGFRGNAEAGAVIKDGVDSKTGIPVVSLYGKNKKPTSEMLADVDIVLFDIQDVGARFYTYISTMHYVMEACSEHQLPLIILDRPNPNGHYVDGPIREADLTSFDGMHPIPIVHGCTVGELAQMINGEGWLQGKKTCALTIIPCENYNHQTPYILPTHPSPNLSTQSAILLYPSLCWFEGTCVSVGRGTDFPFCAIGFPRAQNMNYSFTPRSIHGVAEHPLHENQRCEGIDLRTSNDDSLFHARSIQISWLLTMYKACPKDVEFFTQPEFFDKLAGTHELRTQVERGASESEIRKSWETGLSNYLLMRSKYLLYPDK